MVICQDDAEEGAWGSGNSNGRKTSSQGTESDWGSDVWSEGIFMIASYLGTLIWSGTTRAFKVSLAENICACPIEVSAEHLSEVCPLHTQHCEPAPFEGRRMSRDFFAEDYRIIDA